MQNSSIDLQKFSVYYFYVASLIFRFNFKSILKVNICGLILHNKLNDLISTRSKNDTINIFFSSLRPILLTSSSDFYYLLSSVYLLEKCGYISVKGDCITKVNDLPNIPSGIIRGKMLTSCLDDLNLLSDKAFIEEVLYYV